MPIPELAPDGLRCGLDNLESAFTAGSLCSGACARVISHRLAQLDELFAALPTAPEGKTCRRWSARCLRAVRRLDRAIATRDVFGPEIPWDRDIERLRTRLRAFADAGCPI